MKKSGVPNKYINQLVESDNFNTLIAVIIVINSILIGVETFYESEIIQIIQKIILAIYLLELLLRWTGRTSTGNYFKDSWNYFDVFIILTSLVPASGALSTLRTLRILRIFKTMRRFEELKIMSIVLLKSMVSLSYTAMFFFIFMYIYAVIGVSLFRYENYVGSEYFQAFDSNPDPYGTLSETFFTLFKMITGEGWDTLRYNLMKFTDVSDWIITSYHVSWILIASFLLLNLVVGVVINNFDQAMKNR